MRAALSHDTRAMTGRYSPMEKVARSGSKQADHSRREPMVISIGIAVLAAIALLSAALVAVPLWTALFG
jgi:hypothetical protein